RYAEVDREHVARRLLERHVSRFCPFEDAIDQSGGSLEEFLAITSVRHQATVANVRFAFIYRRQPFGRSVVENTLAIENGQRVGHHQDRIRRLTIHCLERTSEIVGLSYTKRLHRDSNRPSRGGRGFVTH